MFCIMQWLLLAQPETASTVLQPIVDLPNHGKRQLMSLQEEAI